MDDIRTLEMRGFTAAVARLNPVAAAVQVGSLSIGLDGDGPERRLAISLRHADGTALVVYLSDVAMGRLGDLIARTYAEIGATGLTGTVQ
jgi:hypothetical protein